MTVTAFDQSEPPKRRHVADDGPNPGLIFTWRGEDLDLARYGRGPYIGSYRLRENGVFWVPGDRDEDAPQHRCKACDPEGA